MKKKGKIDFSELEKVTRSAPMKEVEDNNNRETKKKLIEFPAEWEKNFKKAFGKASISSYILQAFREKLLKDRIL